MNPDLSAGTQHIFDMAKVGINFDIANFFHIFATDDIVATSKMQTL